MSEKEQVIGTILNVQNNLVNATENIQTNLINTIKNAQNNIITSISQTPSYLYSLVLPNATFERNSNGGILSFDRFTEDYSIIQFSDRPFRESKNITMSEFINLFKTSGINSFQEDPPNGVLLHDEEQRTYSIKLFENNLNELDVVKFRLDLLQGQTHNLRKITGHMSFFVDSGSDASYIHQYTDSFCYIFKKSNTKFNTISSLLDPAYSYITLNSNDISKNILWVQLVSDVSKEIQPTDNRSIKVQLIEGTGPNTNDTKVLYNDKYYHFTIEKQYQVNLTAGLILQGPHVN